MDKFKSHQGFTRTFKENKLTLGISFPFEISQENLGTMDLTEQTVLAKQAEDLGFASLFVRDSPLYDSNFGDNGVLYDPFLLLAYLSAHTKKIALGTASVVTTLRYPLHLAKSAASFDDMSKQRFLFGVATGDRPIEFPAFKVERDERDELFRESILVMRKVWQESFPKIQSKRVGLIDGDVIPKPLLNDIPILSTGYSGQTVEWLAENTDGWIFYAQEANRQLELIKLWRKLTVSFKPFSQPLVINLLENQMASPYPIPIKVGFTSGHKFLIDYLYALQSMGVNHVILVLKNVNRPITEVIQELGEYVVPHFPALTK
ncbi:LLM class oxidoreductase [Bacillus thuringiensis]|uniref:LLM class oxidoreductase n=1 Tax=Bacillus thuringiensis TaxID=1428 RepID=UPI000BF2D074|nr:LLM class oxidoreductase [Bacillus thuringiensis]MED2752297.1 LLM class oxidoreductase [Bacillus thuringiensis]MED2759771.1 LLM class oxidoreductase [Bacillus thuringiensis]MED2769261.1 LLM class oxidoreductase [Bacillus thuringiensis]MED2776646.1 LLM class oxidoreductase [Bacillus thuringiensis]MED2782929.1 LLM class oxidoreductase [Bacillus thuringiensis]